MKYDGIIFDIDGTIASTNQLIFDTFNFVAKKYLGRIFTTQEIIDLFGPPEDIILQKLFKEELESATKDYYQYYKSNHYKAEAYPGIKDLISELKSRSRLLSVYTGKGRKSSQITLEETGLINYFDMIVTGDDVDEHKPSAEGINMFIEKFDLRRNRVLMIGDSVSDIKAALSAGVDYASVIWDSYAIDKVRVMNSENLFHTVQELRSYIFNT